MRTKLFSFIIVGTLLATGVVSAYTEPAGSYPNGQVETVVHVGPEQQIKTGAFWAKLLQAGSKVTNTASLAGYVLGETISIAPSGFFTHMVLPGSDSQFRLGGVSTALSETIRDNESNSLFGFIFKNLNKTTDNRAKNILDNNRAPFTIDLAGRGTQGSAASRDALAVIAHGMCSPVAIITDASGISFRSDYNKNLSDTNLQSEYADILARQLRLRRGNPGPEKVLVSVDRLGNAMWGTLKFTPVKNSAGVTTDMKVEVLYDKNSSPVRASQMMCGLEDPKEPIIGCTDPRYTQNGNYNANATQSGDCTCNTGYEFDSVAGKCEKPKSWKLITNSPNSSVTIPDGRSGQSCKSWIEATSRNYPNAQFRVVETSRTMMDTNNPYLNTTMPTNVISRPPQEGMCLYKANFGGVAGCIVQSINQSPIPNTTPTANCQGYSAEIIYAEPWQPGGNGIPGGMGNYNYYFQQFQVYE